MAKVTEEARVLPFTEADFVGPEDRPSAPWEIAMYDWGAFANGTVKAYLDQMDGAMVSALQFAPKVEQGVIYAQACDPKAPKAHNVTVTAQHKTAWFSLYTALLPFAFKKPGKNYKAVFTCEPKKYGDAKVLVIHVTGYRVEKVDKQTQADAAAVANQQVAAAKAGPDSV